MVYFDQGLLIFADPWRFSMPDWLVRRTERVGPLIVEGVLSLSIEDRLLTPLALTLAGGFEVGTADYVKAENGFAISNLAVNITLEDRLVMGSYKRHLVEIADRWLGIMP